MWLQRKKKLGPALRDALRLKKVEPATYRMVRRPSAVWFCVLARNHRGGASPPSIHSPSPAGTRQAVTWGVGNAAGGRRANMVRHGTRRATTPPPAHLRIYGIYGRSAVVGGVNTTSVHGDIASTAAEGRLGARTCASRQLKFRGRQSDSVTPRHGARACALEPAGRRPGSSRCGEPSEIR